MSGDQLQATFRPRARLLRLLGESLLRDEVVALIELVKNAHDADASFVEVRLQDVRTKDGQISVIDDGSGMSMDKISGPWMEIGTDDKCRNKYTLKGRRVLGEKGIGRFAADKLAEKMEVITKTKESAQEICAIFDWSKYDEAVYLDQVQNYIETREPKVIQNHGTVLVLTHLRTVWDRNMADKLHMGLLRLVSPLKRIEGFNIRLVSNDFPDLQGELRDDIFEKAPYRLKAEVRASGQVICKINEKITREIHFVKNKKEMAPDCGAFKVELYAWELTSEVLHSLGIGVTKARQLIKSWSGANIYRDSFRILPYGEEGEDWLELDRRRIDNPTVNFSRNQILGYVQVTSEANPRIIDQTNREGLIQNSAYFDLRDCALQILKQLENYRLELNIEKRKEKKEKTPAVILDDVLNKLSEIKPGPAINSVVENVLEAKQAIEIREEEMVEALSRYQRSLTIGQMAKNIIHEVKQPVATIIEESDNGLIALKRDPPNHVFLEESFQIVKERGHFIDKITAKWSPFIMSQRQKRKFNICEAIQNVFMESKEGVARINVNCEYPDPSALVANVEMDYADAFMIFRNLLSNSLYWLEVSAKPKPKIRVTVKPQRDKLTIMFRDNGPGIKLEYYDKIFLPGWTLKQNGSGLGLSIVGEILDYYNGKIELVSTPTSNEGAKFRIELPSA